MKKTLTLPLSYKEVGEILIQGAPGYKPEDKEKWLKKFAIEGFLHSMTPAGQHAKAMKLKLNPKSGKGKRRKTTRKELRHFMRNPQLPKAILQIADQIRPDTPGALLMEVEGESRQALDHRIRGAVGQITRALLGAKFGLEPKNFAIAKDADDAQILKVYLNQYTAYAVAMTIMAALNPVFAVKEETLDSLIAGLKDKPLGELNKRKSRESFAQSIYEALKIPSGEMEDKLKKARVEAK